MKIAPIPPTALLERHSTDYHLCLAHVLGSDSRQVDYYRSRSALGDYVILDNGAYELGRSVPFEYVLEIAEAIKPNEIVLPDVFLDTIGTVEAAFQGFEMLRHDTKWDNVNLMVAPQGESLNDWIKCLKALATIMPDSIGIPIVYERKMGRGILIHEVVKLFKFNKDVQPEIHLLGWDGDLYKISAYARQFQYWLRGIDSAKPFYYAKKPLPQNIASGLQLNRPKDYFDLTEEDIDTRHLLANLELMHMAAQGDLGKLYL